LKMSKNANRGLVVLALVLIVFGAIAFAIPVERTAVFWIALVCGLIAILFQIYIFHISFSKEDARSRFYGFPIARLGTIYLVLQLIISLAEMALSKVIPVWAVVILNLLILALAVIGCITAETMRDEIAKQDDKLKKSVSNMRELQSLTVSLVSQTNDTKLQGMLKKVADEFRYSDPLTSAKTASLEEDMRRQIEDLQQALSEEDTAGTEALCGKLLDCLRERNRICALNK